MAVTLFSFVGVPPLIGFFAKQMILSAALDNGYVFMCLIAILTSVISAVYYLAVIKQIFFDKNNNIINPALSDFILNKKTDNNSDVQKQAQASNTRVKVEETKEQNIDVSMPRQHTEILQNNQNGIYGIIYDKSNTEQDAIEIKENNIVLSSSLTSIISILTLIILLFIFIPEQSISLASILALIIFNP